MLFVNFKAYNSYVTDSLYQWDINQKLNIVGLSLTEAPEVHFANANMDRAIVREATINQDTITVTIPNSLLQEPLPIKAYIGVYEGETFKVIESIKIPVIPKERPTDYKFEDDGGEIYSYNEILNKLIAFENKFGDIDPDAIRGYNEWATDVLDLKTRVTPIELGGTGASTSEEALKNLGALPKTLGIKIFEGSYIGNGSTYKSNGYWNSVDLPTEFDARYFMITASVHSDNSIRMEKDISARLPVFLLDGNQKEIYGFTDSDANEDTYAKIENGKLLWAAKEGTAYNQYNDSNTEYFYAFYG